MILTSGNNFLISSFLLEFEAMAVTDFSSSKRFLIAGEPFLSTFSFVAFHICEHR